MSIALAGISHHRTPVELRERVAYDREAAGQLARQLAREGAEAVCLSTCNRTEIYVVPASTAFHADHLKEWLRRWKRTDVPNAQLFALHAASA